MNIKEAQTYCDDLSGRYLRAVALLLDHLSSIKKRDIGFYNQLINDSLVSDTIVRMTHDVNMHTEEMRQLFTHDTVLPYQSVSRDLLSRIKLIADTIEFVEYQNEIQLNKNKPKLLKWVVVGGLVLLGCVVIYFIKG